MTAGGGESVTTALTGAACTGSGVAMADDGSAVPCTEPSEGITGVATVTLVVTGCATGRMNGRSTTTGSSSSIDAVGADRSSGSGTSASTSDAVSIVECEYSSCGPRT